MIARLYVPLPYTFWILQDTVLAPLESDWGDYQVIVYPLCQARVGLDYTKGESPMSVLEVVESLRPSDTPIVTDCILVDGSPIIQANLLQIDFRKPDFDRRPPTEPMGGDPPIELVLEIVNDFLGALRSVAQAGHVKPLDPLSVWRLDYLADDGSELPAKEGLIQGRFASGFHWQVSVLNEAIWDGVRAVIPGYKSSTWETLLLDAKALLPEVGPALVLAFTALETLIAATLEQLVSQIDMPDGLWQWINDRGDYRKEPSVEEKFDILLSALANKSLKEEGHLWKAFKNLKEARNSFVHEGRAVLGKNKEEVTPEKASSLIAKARDIVRWVEPLLPSEMRSLGIEQRFDVEVSKQLAPPSGTERGHADEAA
jgi:hypothetical protein